MEQNKWKKILAEGQKLVTEKTDNETLKNEYKSWSRGVKKGLNSIGNNKYYRLAKLIQMDFKETKEWREIENEIKTVWHYGWLISKTIDNLDSLIEDLPKK
jgi:hypothetical protein